MTVTAQPVTAAPGRAATAGPRWLLSILLTGQFMAMLDVAIVNVAAPTILTELPARAAAAGPRWLLSILLTGQFMAMLDVAIVNVAAPTIRTELNASGAGLQ